MRRLLAMAFGVFGLASFLAVTAGALMQSPSRDTCTASGRGTAYTLNITIPAGAPQQFGFGFGAPGATVTNINVAGTDGTLATQSLPAHTSGSWISLSPLLPGSAVVDLTTSGPITGSFMVVPASGSQPKPTYLDPLRCALSPGSPLPSNKFTVDRQTTYDPAAREWHLTVMIPGPGTVSANELESTFGGATSKSVTAKAQVQSRKVTLTTSGKVTLTLRPTAGGLQALKANGHIKLRMNVAFVPRDGSSASTIVSLTLTE